MNRLATKPSLGHPLRWLPNAISFSRLILVIPYVWLFWRHFDSPYLLILALIIILTDKLDGTLARRFKCESQLGETLDATGDQVFIISSWILFWLSGVIPFLVLALIIGFRVLQAVSLIIRKIRNGQWNTEHLIWGKLGVSQFVAILWLLLEFPYAMEIVWISVVLLFFGVLISELKRHKLI